MKSDIEIRDLVYNAIKDSALEQAVVSAGGKLYKSQRPANSGREDIVISVLDGSNGQPQSAVLDVNIYVKDTAQGDDMTENEPRVRELSKLAIELMEDFTEGDCRFGIEKQLCFKVEGVDEHCINNKVLLTILNH